MQEAVTEEDRLIIIGRCVDLAFEEPDPYMRNLYQSMLLKAKWVRLTILNGVF